MMWLQESLHSKLAVITVIESLDQFLFDYAPDEEISVTSNAGKIENYFTWTML